MAFKKCRLQSAGNERRLFRPRWGAFAWNFYQLALGLTVGSQHVNDRGEPARDPAAQWRILPLREGPPVRSYSDAVGNATVLPH
jgi:hypothetical protein